MSSARSLLIAVHTNVALLIPFMWTRRQTSIFFFAFNSAGKTLPKPLNLLVSPKFQSPICMLQFFHCSRTTSFASYTYYYYQVDSPSKSVMKSLFLCVFCKSRRFLRSIDVFPCLLAAEFFCWFLLPVDIEVYIQIISPQPVTLLSLYLSHFYIMGMLQRNKLTKFIQIFIYQTCQLLQLA